MLPMPTFHLEPFFITDLITPTLQRKPLLFFSFPFEIKPTIKTIGKMRILCLHGAGTGPLLMKRQISKLIECLDPSWEFYFLAGNIEGNPGPGKIKNFQTCKNLII